MSRLHEVVPFLGRFPRVEQSMRTALASLRRGLQPLVLDPAALQALKDLAEKAAAVPPELSAEPPPDSPPELLRPEPPAPPEPPPPPAPEPAPEPPPPAEPPPLSVPVPSPLDLKAAQAALEGKYLLNRYATPLQLFFAAQNEIIGMLGADSYYAIEYQPWEHWREVAVIDWVFADQSRKQPVKKVLDIGPAYGTFLAYCRRLFPRAQLHAYDLLEHFMPKQLAEHARIKCHRGNIELDAFPTKDKFDIILFTEILEHLNFYSAATLKKIGGLLAEGGRLYLTTPNQQHHGRRDKYHQSFKDFPLPSAPAAGFNWVDDHTWHFAAEEIEEVVAEAGLEIERFEAVYSSLDGPTGGHLNYCLVKSSLVKKKSRAKKRGS